MSEQVRQNPPTEQPDKDKGRLHKILTGILSGNRSIDAATHPKSAVLINNLLAEMAPTDAEAKAAGIIPSDSVAPDAGKKTVEQPSQSNPVVEADADKPMSARERQLTEQNEALQAEVAALRSGKRFSRPTETVGEKTKSTFDRERERIKQIQADRTSILDLVRKAWKWTEPARDAVRNAGLKTEQDVRAGVSAGISGAKAAGEKASFRIAKVDYSARLALADGVVGGVGVVSETIAKGFMELEDALKNMNDRKPRVLAQMAEVFAHGVAVETARFAVECARESKQIHSMVDKIIDDVQLTMTLGSVEPQVAQMAERSTHLMSEIRAQGAAATQEADNLTGHLLNSMDLAVASGDLGEAVNHANAEVNPEKQTQLQSALAELVTSNLDLVSQQWYVRLSQEKKAHDLNVARLTRLANKNKPGAADRLAEAKAVRDRFMRDRYAPAVAYAESEIKTLAGQQVMDAVAKAKNVLKRYESKKAQAVSTPDSGVVAVPSVAKPEAPADEPVVAVDLPAAAPIDAGQASESIAPELAAENAVVAEPVSTELGDALTDLLRPTDGTANVLGNDELSATSGSDSGAVDL